MSDWTLSRDLFLVKKKETDHKQTWEAIHTPTAKYVSWVCTHENTLVGKFFFSSFCWHSVYFCASCFVVVVRCFLTPKVQMELWTAYCTCCHREFPRSQKSLSSVNSRQWRAIPIWLAPWPAYVCLSLHGFSGDMANVYRCVLFGAPFFLNSVSVSLARIQKESQI